MNATNALHIEIQTNKNETKGTGQNDTNKKLSNFCLDVAKYIFTGVFFATIFALIKNVVWIIFFSGILVVAFVLAGIILNKMK
jgi:hypothetical protein